MDLSDRLERSGDEPRDDGASDPCAGLRAEVGEQQRRIEALLAYRQQRGRLEQDARVRWTGDVLDPEFEKNLRVLHRLVAAGLGIAERACPHVPVAEHMVAQPATEPTRGGGRLRHDDLIHHCTLPQGTPLTLEMLLEHRFGLEHYLLEVGDESYLRLRAAELYDEPDSTATTWRDLYGDEPPPVLADVIGRFPNAGLPAESPPPTTAPGVAEPPAEPPLEEAVTRTRRMLSRLIAVKASEDLPTRARRKLKQRALWLVVQVLLVATSLLGVAVGLVTGDWEFLLPAAAGATGATLGRLVNLRDEVNRGAQVREFIPVFAAQVVVGAAAGILVFLITASGFVQVVGGTSGVAAVALAVGYSEAAFLGLVGKLGASVESKQAAGGGAEAEG